MQYFTEPPYFKTDYREYCKFLNINIFFPNNHILDRFYAESLFT